MVAYRCISILRYYTKYSRVSKNGFVISVQDIYVLLNECKRSQLCEIKLLPSITMEKIEDIPYNPLVSDICALRQMEPDHPNYNTKVTEILDAFAPVDKPNLIAHLRVFGLLWKDALRESLETEIESYDGTLGDDLVEMVDFKDTLKILDVFLMPRQNSEKQNTPSAPESESSDKPNKRKRIKM